jgi:hypothetical protein
MIVRKLKSQNDLNGAMIFLMQLAHTLGDAGQWVPAVTSARRSIEMFPRQSTSIQTYLKQLFFQFADRIDGSSNAVTPDLFRFYAHLMYIFPATTRTILKKQAILADMADEFFISNKHYQHFFTLFPPEDMEDDEPWRIFALMLVRWVQSLPEAVQVAQAQFIICRAVLAISACGKTGPAMAQKLLNMTSGLVLVGLFHEWLEQPLFRFTELFLKALTQKHELTIDTLIKKYEKILNVDRDLPVIVRRARNIQLPQVHSSSGGGIAALTRVLEALMNNGPPPDHP